MKMEIYTRRSNATLEIDKETEVAEDCVELAKAINDIFSERLITTKSEDNYVTVFDDDVVHEIMITEVGICILRTSIGSIGGYDITYNMAENWHKAIFILGEIMGYECEEIMEKYEKYM